jgi:hypothetical protein
MPPPSISHDLNSSPRDMAGPHGRLVELINKPEMSAHTNDRDSHDVIRPFTAKICNEYRNMEDWEPTWRIGKFKHCDIVLD